MKRKIIHLIQSIFLSRGLFVTHTMRLLGRKRRIDITDRMDYVRMSSLDLISEEIYTRQLEGNVAELGVYKGDFAVKIHQAFPERILYLFDTFEGFKQKDIDLDKQNNYSTGTQDFSDTNVEYVLGRMTTPGNCIVKKGFFPGTAEGVNDKFIFVSIDTDLYQPIYEGLKYFYPLLNRGGYIFIHDFNNAGYKGARQAVIKFCEENEIGYFPLSDGCGSAVICK